MDEIGYNKQLLWLMETGLFNTTGVTISDISFVNQIREICNRIIDNDSFSLTNDDIVQLLIDTQGTDMDDYINVLFSNTNVTYHNVNLLIDYLHSIKDKFRTSVLLGVTKDIITPIFDVDRLFNLPDIFLVYDRIEDREGFTLVLWRVMKYKGMI